MTEPVDPSIIGEIIARMSGGISFIADRSLSLEEGDIEASIPLGEPSDDAAFGTHIREAIRVLRNRKD